MVLPNSRNHNFRVTQGEMMTEEFENELPEADTPSGHSPEPVPPLDGIPLGAPEQAPEYSFGPEPNSEHVPAALEEKPEAESELVATQPYPWDLPLDEPAAAAPPSPEPQTAATATSESEPETAGVPLFPWDEPLNFDEVEPAPAAAAEETELEPSLPAAAVGQPEVEGSPEPVSIPEPAAIPEVPSVPGPLRIAASALSDIGCVRKNNEDSFGYDEGLGIYVVCDGMGGMASGEVASAHAVAALVSTFAATDNSGIPVSSRLNQAIIAANQDVWTHGQLPENRGMGTTAVAAARDGDS